MIFWLWSFDVDFRQFLHLCSTPLGSSKLSPPVPFRNQPNIDTRVTLGVLTDFPFRSTSKITFPNSVKHIPFFYGRHKNWWTCLLWVLMEKRTSAWVIFSKICYVACVINCTGKMVCLHVCLHECNRTGLTDKTASYVAMISYYDFSKAWIIWNILKFLVFVK